MRLVAEDSSESDRSLLTPRTVVVKERGTNKMRLKLGHEVGEQSIVMSGDA